MIITGISPWFGSKRTLAPKIVDQLGPHRCYWEPFCGSMAVLMAKPPCSSETVNDLHYDVTNLARVIQHPIYGAQLYRRLRRVLVSEKEFTLAKFVLSFPVVYRTTEPISMGEVNRAFFFFVSSWMGRSGFQGSVGENKSFAKRYTSNGGDTAGRFVSAVESIPQWRRRLRSVSVLTENAFDLINKVEDKVGTVMYVDPPYLIKSTKYVYDFTDPQHHKLARLLHRFEHTRVVVSYYDHPMIRDYYPTSQWNVVDCSRSKNLVSTSSRDKENTTLAPEVLFVNGRIIEG